MCFSPSTVGSHFHSLLPSFLSRRLRACPSSRDLKMSKSRSSLGPPGAYKVVGRQTLSPVSQRAGQFQVGYRERGQTWLMWRVPGCLELGRGWTPAAASEYRAGAVARGSQQTQEGRY